MQAKEKSAPVIPARRPEPPRTPRKEDEFSLVPCPRRRSSRAQLFHDSLHGLDAIGVGWSESRMHFEVGQCLSQTALHLPRDAAVVVGLGIFRIEPDRLVEIRDRAVEIALGTPGAAAVDVGDRKSTRSELQSHSFISYA